MNYRFRMTLVVFLTVLLSIFVLGFGILAKAEANTVNASVYVDKGLLTVGSPIKWTAKAEGTGLTYAWYIYKDGQRVKIVWYNSKNYLEYIPEAPGKYKVTVFVKAATGKVNMVTSAEETVKALSLSSLKPNVASPKGLGSTVRWTATASGKGLTYAWYIYKDGKVVETVWYKSKNYFDWTPKAKGNYQIRVWVKDAYGNITNQMSPVYKITNILSTKQTGSGALGTKLKWTTNVSGQNLTYAWYLYKDNKVIKTVWYGTKSYFEYTPNTAGTYKVRVFVKNAKDETVSELSASNKIEAIIFGELKMEKISGTTLKWTANAQGKDLTYAWYIYKGDTRVNTVWYRSSNVLEWTPSVYGEYKVRLFVKDAYGNTVSETSEQMAAGGMLIMGKNQATASQMIKYYFDTTTAKDYAYIQNFVDTTILEANAEGIRADVAFALMMKETNFLRFGGDVKQEQNNFGGLGATGNGVPGESFPDVQTGIRAIIQHLKAYATVEPLNQALVDNRYKYVAKGSAPFVEWLGINENPSGKGWATDLNYGYDIVYRVNVMKGKNAVAGMKIVLDSGHGGSDPGAVKNGYYEKDLNKKLTQKIYDKLTAKGINVVLTKPLNTDTYMSLQDRAEFANSQNADLFLSIHHDSNTDTTAKGFSTHYSSYRPGIEINGAYVRINGKNYPFVGEDTEKKVFIYNDNGVIKSVSYLTSATAYDATPSVAAQKSKALAIALGNSVTSLGLVNRGAIDHNLYLTRWTNMVSVLIEAGFISNATEAKKLADPVFQEQLAQKIVDTILNNFVN